MTLKYRFQATYNDGSVYIQHPNDISVSRPPEEKKSSFTDVKVDEVKEFFIYNDEHTYSVSLKDGHFEADNASFFLHQEAELLKDFKLIYKRNVKHSQKFQVTLGDKVQDNPDGTANFEIASNKPVGEPEIITSFVIGWKAINNKGESIEKFIEVY